MRTQFRERPSGGRQVRVNSLRSATSNGIAATMLLVSLLGTLVFSSGCIHQTVIRTVPEGATISIDGEDLGASPVVVDRPLGLFGTMTIEASMQSYTTETLEVERNAWFLWPALIALLPAFALPTVVIPFAGPFIALGWAVATSPALISLFFVRRYPGEITINLAPRLSVIENLVLPTDAWTVPEDYAPNPLPPGANTPLPPQKGMPVPQGRNPPPNERNPPLQTLPQ